MTVLERFKEKSRREPLVPIGCAATLACLGAGLYAFSKGNSALSQKLMRARVAAQGATVIVFCVGSYAVSQLQSTTDTRPKGMSKIEYELIQKAKEESDALAAARGRET